MDFTDGIKKIFLAGVGAVAMTAEKSSELVDDLVKKGELTVEQGKALNEELKHKQEDAQRAKKYSSAAVKGDFSEMLSHLTDEQKEALRQQLEKEETREKEEKEEKDAETKDAE